MVEPEDLRPAGIRIGASVPDVPRVAPVAVRGKQVTLVADQVHDRAAAHVMPILVGRAGLERLIPARLDSRARAISGLGGAGHCKN